MIKTVVSFSDFAKLDFRVGRVQEAELVDGSEKLVKLNVDFGAEIGARNIFSGIKSWYEPQNLVGRKLIFVVNLEPKKFKINGVEHESQGMLLSAGDNRAVLYSFDQELQSGEIVH